MPSSTCEITRPQTWPSFWSVVMKKIWNQKPLRLTHQTYHSLGENVNLSAINLPFGTGLRHPFMVEKEDGQVQRLTMACTYYAPWCWYLYPNSSLVYKGKFHFNGWLDMIGYDWGVPTKLLVMFGVNVEKPCHLRFHVFHIGLGIHQASHQGGFTLNVHPP